MTRGEALEILDHNWTRLVNPDYTDEELGKAQDMAIEALENESMNVQCADMRGDTDEC